MALTPRRRKLALTGLVCSLGSIWGLFRHYWVLFKLLINVVATIVLLLYMQILDYLAEVAAVATCPVVNLAGCGAHPRCFTPAPPSCCWSWPRRWPSISPRA